MVVVGRPPLPPLALAPRPVRDREGRDVAVAVDGGEVPTKKEALFAGEDGTEDTSSVVGKLAVLFLIPASDERGLEAPLESSRMLLNLSFSLALTLR